MNIVFDLDGTLIDSAPDIQAAAAAVLAGVDREPLTLAETRGFIGEGSAVFVNRMMAARGIEATPETQAGLHDAFLAQYEFALDRAEFYPGVPEVLVALRATGHRLGLCTNKPHRPTLAVLSYMRLEPLFDTVVAGGMLASRKPEPAMLLHAISELGGGPALYVGDSEIDSETARRAVVPFALFTGGYRKAAVEDLHRDWAFDDHAALPGIVAEAGSGARPLHTAPR